MFCEQCGKEIPGNSKFCAGCGAKVEPAEATAQEAPMAEPAETENLSYQEPPRAEPARPVPPPAPAVQKTQYNDRTNLVKPLSIGSYVGMLILLWIPIVNIIMLLVWSFSDTVNINKKHLAIAILVMVLIGIVLGIVFGVLTAILGAGFYRFYY
ncbi:MAG: zinc ribbon domain-containing protein [Clostridia bacterium]